VALGALRTFMENSRRYEYLPGHELVGVAEHAAIDHRGVHYGGDHVVLCLGATLSGFAAELFEDEPLRKVRLYMAETESFDGSLTTSVANGDSFRYYPGFAEIARDVLEDQPAATPNSRFSSCANSASTGVSRLAIRTSLKYRAFSRRWIVRWTSSRRPLDW